MIYDLCALIAGIVVFTVLAILKNGKNALKKETIIFYFSKNLLLSGCFVSVVNVLFLFSKLEIELTSKNIEFSTFLILVFIKLRPLLFALLVKIIVYPFELTSHGGYGRMVEDSKILQDNEDAKVKNLDCLSVREREVAKLASLGYSNLQIAEELYISVETVKRHMATIFEKLDISSRHEIPKK